MATAPLPVKPLADHAPVVSFTAQNHASIDALALRTAVRWAGAGLKVLLLRRTPLSTAEVFAHPRIRSTPPDPIEVPEPRTVKLHLGGTVELDKVYVKRAIDPGSDPLPAVLAKARPRYEAIFATDADQTYPFFDQIADHYIALLRSPRFERTETRLVGERGGLKRREVRLRSAAEAATELCLLEFQLIPRNLPMSGLVFSDCTPPDPWTDEGPFELAVHEELAARHLPVLGHLPDDGCVQEYDLALDAFAQVLRTTVLA
ncbi:MAG: hypothetical protein HOY69_02525 [Streptomyces sp.]|nr:hypothetical protein [Streptomyces sp.]